MARSASHESLTTRTAAEMAANMPREWQRLLGDAAAWRRFEALRAQHFAAYMALVDPPLLRMLRPSYWRAWRDADALGFAADTALYEAICSAAWRDPGVVGDPGG